MALRVALAQMNAVVGDLDGNVALMREFLSRAQGLECDIVVFPEMSVCGYPPEDLLHRPAFIKDNRTALEAFAADCMGITALVGFAEGQGEGVYNSLAVVTDGRIEQLYQKGLLPNYGVFDEARYFEPGQSPLIVNRAGIDIAFTICEDIWDLGWLDGFIKDQPEPDVILNMSASPFHRGKLEDRKRVLTECAKHFKCALGYCNLVGGQDELVFDGQSMFLDPAGHVIEHARAFEEDLLVADIELDEDNSVTIVSHDQNHKAYPLELIPEVYQALVLGVKDYVRKNGFGRVLIGLSGGIDSALTAAIAVDALGAENVVGVTMPSRFNTDATISDAEALATNMGIEFHTLPIASMMAAFSGTLSHFEKWDERGVAYENLQARIRGTLLMTMSNQFGLLVLTTGNKSETAVGYSTLYGDTAGGFAVIKDVPKTIVFKLSYYVNERHGREVIPVTTIERIPSAELRENQKDSDSLPDYDLLDTLLREFVENKKSPTELIAMGFDREAVMRITRLIDRNEYKRRQSPPGIKITPRAFGKDRRMPITNRYLP